MIVGVLSLKTRFTFSSILARPITMHPLSSNYFVNTFPTYPVQPVTIYVKFLFINITFEKILYTLRQKKTNRNNCDIIANGI